LSGVLAFLASFYWLYLPEVIVESLWLADWKGAYQHDGVMGIIKESLRSVLGTNTYPFFVPMNSPWWHNSLHPLLATYGVKTLGWGFANGELFFRVKKRQAAWAQYIMLRAGVPLMHRLLAEEPVSLNSATEGSSQAERPIDSVPPCYTVDFERQFRAVFDRVISILGL
jgi:hypothetical protein